MKRAFLSLNLRGLGIGVSLVLFCVVARAEDRPRRSVRAFAPTPVIAPAPEGHYDEIFTTEVIDGETMYVVRPEYRDVVAAVRGIREGRMGKIGLDTKRDFSGENSLSVLPRIFRKDFYESQIKLGVDQRGRALSLFLQDYYRSDGRPSISRKGILPQSVLNNIVFRHGESGFLGRVNPDNLPLFYGPDISRDRLGRPTVIEDSVGFFLGGLGDLRIAGPSLKKNVPEYPELSESDPLEFYKDLVRAFKTNAVPARGKTILVGAFDEKDHEAMRFRDILFELGVEFVTPKSASKIEFDDVGAWYKRHANSRRERVGFIIAYGEFNFLDGDHEIQKVTRMYQRILSSTESERREREAARVAGTLGQTPMSARLALYYRVIAKVDPKTRLPSLAVLNEYFEAMRMDDIPVGRFPDGFPGLSEAILRGRVGSNITPGTDFVGDKEFYGYVDDIIRHYLGEEPILRSIPTVKVKLGSGPGYYQGLDAEFKAQLLLDKDTRVIKRVNGRGGEGTWVGPKITAHKYGEGVDALNRDPSFYIAQEYDAMSVVGREIADIRVFSYVPPGARSSVVSNFPWGRSVPLSGNGKVNISSTGKEMAVHVRSASKVCSLLFASGPHVWSLGPRAR